ncbi:unnamed protein product [Protopolystoma xenopodis]|uniref:Uncharacterized protein n=1 Tax=Protopolystoma xenopodis TaxID=117903 RepID=A0A3S5FEV5_9PLAT|nr:unnamed protein product [Protopolystoma xenopodis]
MVDATATNPDWLLPALRAAAKCTLLQATYLALRGQAEEAADLLNRLVKAHDATDGMIASPVVKMNALVKTACLAMTVNQVGSGLEVDFI